MLDPDRPFPRDHEGLVQRLIFTTREAQTLREALVTAELSERIERDRVMMEAELDGVTSASGLKLAADRATSEKFRTCRELHAQLVSMEEERDLIKTLLTQSQADARSR
jgi:hypothetical protein